MSSSSSSSAAGWLPGWNKRLALTIDSSLVDADLTNFPVLIHLSSSSGISSKDVTKVFDEVGENSKKIAVTQPDGVSQCYVEIEEWIGDSPIDSNSESSSSEGIIDGRNAYLWSKIPLIERDIDTILYLYYDNAHADNTTYVGDVNSAVGSNVWNSGYKAVYHLSESGIGTRFDSTSNNHDGTPQNYDGDEDVKAKINGGDSLDGADDWILVGDSVDWDFGKNDFTIDFWINPVSNTDWQGIMSAGKVSSPYGWTVYSRTSGWIRLSVDGGSTDIIRSVNAKDLGVWNHFVITRKGIGANDLEIYKNGSINNSASGNVDVDGTGACFEIGRYYCNYDGFYVPAIMDEVRISKANRSASYIKADYNSGNDSLITFGDEELV